MLSTLINFLVGTTSALELRTVSPHMLCDEFFPSGLLSSFAAFYMVAVTMFCLHV